MAVLALSALQANFADALGLGNLAIKSALNQPLNAEIKLLDTGDLDPSQIKIQLAAPEDFQRAGVDRDFFLTNLRFSVDMNGHGGGTIKVSTREPVVEPYLNFVIEARWPNGRLLREFAVLLDPPTFSANKGAAQIAPATSSSAQPATRTPVQPPTVKSETETTKTAPPADMSLPATGKTDEYRIQVYDTLSKIATRFKPAGDVSVAQTMIAIQRANPQVFIRNNVNLIKSGYVLRLPSADEARSITADQAVQEVNSQNQEWRSGRHSSFAATAATGPQLDATAPEPSNKAGGFREQARLSIATSGESDKSAAGSGGSGKAVEALRNQLTASQETLEKGKRDNKELQSRLDDMERQIATLQRLISLKDDQLTALQNKPASAKSAPQAVPNTAKTAPATPPAPAQIPAVEPATGVVPAAEAPAAAAPEIKPEPPQPAPAAAKPRPTPTPEPGLLDQLMANPIYIVGAAAALVLALIGFVMAKRRKDAEQEENDTLAFDDGDSFQFDNADLDNASISDDAITTAEPQSTAETPINEAPVETPRKSVRSETGDAIAESDIYIAYGRYQQAVDLLSHAIDTEPNRSDLRVKLLEVFVEMRNKDAFRQQFVALQGLGDSKAVAHVKDMLSSVDGISDWLDDLPGGSSSSSYVAPVVTAAAAAATAAAIAEDESDADANLDLDLELEDDTNANQPSATIMNLDSDFGSELNSFASSTAQSEEAPEFTLDLDDEIDDGSAAAEFTSDFS
ncbi:MAG TPA: FimV/HubP family polar landmark protein, partial [Spongiibacteraceae bacterium]